MLSAPPSAGIGSSRGVIAAPELGTRSVEQSTRRENGEFSASTSSPVCPSAVNRSGTAVPALAVVSEPYGPVAGDWKSRRQLGWVSNASLLSLRLVVPWTALKPSPRRANVAHTVHVSAPSDSSSAAAMIARLATTRPGPQPWSLSPSITYCSARLLPPLFHGSYRSGLNPYLSIRSQFRSHSTAAQPWPRPCGSASDAPFSQARVLMLSYVKGWVAMLRV